VIYTSHRVCWIIGRSSIEKKEWKLD